LSRTVTQSSILIPVVYSVINITVLRTTWDIHYLERYHKSSKLDSRKCHALHDFFGLIDHLLDSVDDVRPAMARQPMGLSA